MLIEDNTDKLMTFEEFAERHELVLTYRERYGNLAVMHGRYMCSFENVESRDGIFLVGVYGNGSTKETALVDYAKRLIGNQLVVDAESPRRQEIQCPNEWAPNK